MAMALALPRYGLTLPEPGATGCSPVVSSGCGVTSPWASALSESNAINSPQPSVCKRVPGFMVFACEVIGPGRGRLGEGLILLRCAISGTEFPHAGDRRGLRTISDCPCRQR